MQKKSGWKTGIKISVGVIILSLAYAIIRYNIIKGTPWENLPLFIFNKAFALASVIIIGLSFVLGPLAKLSPKKFSQKLFLRRSLGLIGFTIAALHALISLLIFSPSYYPKFFNETGKLTLEGELSMLFGALALFIFAIVAITSLPSIENKMNKKHWLSIQRSGYLAFFLVLLHVAFMGFKGWLVPADWPGGLPPISLIAFVIIALILSIRILTIFVKSSPYQNSSN